VAARILIVDDEPSILATMAPLLRARGYEVATATTGHAALDAVDRQPPQLVILDLGLPDLDGIEVARRLREGRSIPILVLSARGAEQDKVAALDAGADDYVTKPFGAEELLARIRVALRRTDGAVPSGVIRRGDLTIDVDRRRVTRGSDELRLTPKELELLLFLAQHPGRVYTRPGLLREVWGYDFYGGTRTVDVHIRRLRAKLGPEHEHLIETVRGVGYRATAEA